MVPTIIGFIDKLWPGGKTYALMGLGNKKHGVFLV